MKSYLAKLADRATQANVQVPSSMHSRKVFDPFEDTSPPQSPLPSTEFTKSERMTREHDGFAPSQLSQTVQAESNLAHFQPLEKPHPEDMERSARSLSSPVSHVPPSQRMLDNEPGAQERISLTAPQVTRQEGTNRQANTSRDESLEPDQAPKSATVPETLKRSDEATKRLQGENPFNDEQLAQMEGEQSILLSKADDFMRRLTEHWRSPKTASEDNVEPGSESMPMTTPHQDESPRLQPTRSVERIPERESARPSLVIGKLTVEVLPPTPPSTAPVQQVVVVRGARWGGSNIHSSRRFGLGQF